MGMALCTTAAMAQETDTTENNAYRRAQKSGEQIDEKIDEGEVRADSTLQNADTTMRNMQRDATNTRDRIRAGARRTGEDIDSAATGAGTSIREGAERTAEDIDSAAEKTGDRFMNELNEASEEVQEETSEAGQELKQEVRKTESDIQQGVQNASGQGDVQKDNQNSGTGTSASGNMTFEVVPDKEGPMNQVVYRINGEHYYVDRERKELVKAEDKDLKDAKHMAIVKDNNTAGNKKGKG